MKEMEAHAGDHIARACERLAKSAPAFMLFNDIRIEAQAGATAGDLVARYQAESARRSAEYEAKRRAYDATDEVQRKIAEARRLQQQRDLARDTLLAHIESAGVRTKYAWTPAMGEISGFGGGYESACRDMLYAGLMLVEADPAATDPAIEAAMLTVCPDCSGAMFGASSGAVRFIATNGWAKYVQRMTP